MGAVRRRSVPATIGPAGGPLSDLGPALLLGLHEASWAQLPHLRRLSGFGALGDDEGLQHKVAILRYVDDEILASRILCCACLEAMVYAIHPSVPFSKEHGSDTGPVPWLDALIEGNRWPPRVLPAPVEPAWISGQAQNPVKFRVQPWLGIELMNDDLPRGHVRGRLARLTQMRHSDAEFLHAVGADILLLLRSGYPPPIVQGLWRRHGGDHLRAALFLPFAGRMITRAQAALAPPTPQSAPAARPLPGRELN